MGTLPAWMLEVISPRPDDSSDLRWAIETVAAMWARGDGRKTLLWLRQAAETARGDGMDDRAGALAQAAAEFERLGLGETTASGEISSPGMPAAAAPPAPSAGPPPAAPSGAHPPAPSSGSQGAATPSGARPPVPSSGSAPRRRLPPTAPYPQADAPTHLQAPASDLIEAIRSVDDTEPDEPPMQSAPRPSRPMPPAVRREPLEPTVVMDEKEQSAAVAAATGAPIPTEPLASPEPLSSENPPTMESPRAALEPMRAVRVAVRLGGSGNELSAVLLGDGEKAPDGTQEAILLAIGGSSRS